MDQKTQKRYRHLSNTNNPFDLYGIHGTPHVTSAEHIFFANARGKITKVAHMTRL